MYTFREQLRTARLKAGLTQEQLADRSGIRAKTISGFENGSGQGSPLTRARLEKALWAEGVELFPEKLGEDV